MWAGDQVGGGREARGIVVAEVVHRGGGGMYWTGKGVPGSCKLAIRWVHDMYGEAVCS